MKIQILFSVVLFMLSTFAITAQAPKTDSNTPLYLMKPDYPVPYGPLKTEDVKEVLNRIRTYLDKVTPMEITDKLTGKAITDFQTINSNAVLQPGAFRIISYEWGVTYSGMLRAGEVTGDPEFTAYATRRIDYVGKMEPYFMKQYQANPNFQNSFISVINPRALDDAGSMCAAMIKTLHSGTKADLRPLIDRYMNFISNKEFRLADGTLARNRPQRNTLWLDDLYMSVPALAQMGKLTGEQKYYDDAVKQILQFSQRMFDKNKNLYLHGWVEEMNVHPAFHWGRANGWALLAMTELLDVLPENHPQHATILNQLRSHILGLMAFQSGNGFWHQLIDRNDSYPETSATAIFAYCMAHAINKGWIDSKAYGPATILAWNAIKTKVNDKGEVEGTCVGTGMGFDPAFYYYRPTSPFAAHGYGPVILAGAEIIQLLKNYQVVINETSVMFYENGIDWKALQIK